VDEYSRVTVGQLYQLKVRANSETGKVKRQHTRTSYERGNACPGKIYPSVIQFKRAHTKLHIAFALAGKAERALSFSPSVLSLSYFIAARGHLAQ